MTEGPGKIEKLAYKWLLPYMPVQVAVLIIFTFISHGYDQSILLQFTILWVFLTIILYAKKRGYDHTEVYDEEDTTKKEELNHT